MTIRRICLVHLPKTLKSRKFGDQQNLRPTPKSAKSLQYLVGKVQCRHQQKQVAISQFFFGQHLRKFVSFELLSCNIKIWKKWKNVCISIFNRYISCDKTFSSMKSIYLFPSLSPSTQLGSGCIRQISQGFLVLWIRMTARKTVTSTISTSRSSCYA